MANLSDWAEKAALDWLLLGATPTRPTAIFVSLHTGSPGDTGTTELGAGSAYARQTATFAAASSGAGTTQNSNTITFGPATTSNWGTISGMGIWDASSSGNLLFWGTLATPRTINIGDSLQFAASGLVCSLA